MTLKRTLLCVAAAALAAPLFAGQPEMTILVGGSPLAEYQHRGTTYIEALRGRDFTIRLHNPTPHRVAVALSVDGLNTIDAKHTDAWSAAKWVLDPWETADIEGWQVSDSAARRFYFTGERNSYGAALGKTANLGIIEAVFYRERRQRYYEDYSRERSEAPPAPAPQSRAEPKASAQAPPNDDYAATGMGHRTQHDVYRIDIDLDRTPIASMAIRYEFRPQLVKLGVLMNDPLTRREKARGFEYCPEPR